MHVYSRRTVGTLIQDLCSLVLEQRGVVFQFEMRGFSGCFGGGGRIELELALRDGVRLSHGYGSGRAGDMVKVRGSTDFDQPGHGIGGVRGRWTFVRNSILGVGVALDEHRGRGRIEASGMDGTNEECEEE